MSLRRALERLKALVRKEHLELELEDEIRTHLQLAEEDSLSRGFSPEAARLEALRHFGSIEHMKEIHRDRRGFRWLETMLRDFRYGVACLRRSPTMTAVIVGILALGIGGTVAMFGVVDAVLLKPLPFSEPDRIVRLWEAPRPGVVNETAVYQFLAWRGASTHVFEALAAESPIVSALNARNGATRLAGKLVTTDYFKIFTSDLALGRTFVTNEDQAGAEPVVVLSHTAWATYFGTDPDILHRRILLDGEPYQVIGVLAPGAFDRDATQFWRPLLFTVEQKLNNNHWLTVYGRLRYRVSLMQAEQRMSAIYSVLAQDQPVGDRGGSIAMENLARLLVGPNLHRSISIAFGAVVLVLLIACANVANLLFAQGASRRAELAVRASLGAGRTRLALQLLTEHFALCTAGGVAGVGVAYGLIRLSAPLLKQSLPFTAAVSLNLDVLIFAIALVFGVVLLAGMVPALQASSDALTEGLKQSARTSPARIRMRRVIVTIELACSFVLVCGALLLVRSLFKLQEVDTGVRIDNILTTSIDLPPDTYPTRQKAALFYEALTQRLRSMPGIQKVGLSTALPLQWISNGEAIQAPSSEKLIRVRLKRVDSGYFNTYGIPVLTGRGITDRDRAGSPRVVVINQALAKSLAAQAGMQNPVGRVVQLSTVTYQEELQSPFQIVGLIRSERTASPGDPDPPVAYVPLAQEPVLSMRLSIQAAGKRDTLLSAIRETVHAVDPNLALGNVATMQQVLDETLLPTSRPAWLIGGYAGIALLLAATGLYGLMSHLVTQRRREIGIRLALGARSSDVLKEILQEGLKMLVPGAVFGLMGALAVTRIMTSLLFEVSPLDPVAVGIAGLLLAATGLFAGFWPANNAIHVDPAVTLRDIG